MNRDLALCHYSLEEDALPQSVKDAQEKTRPPMRDRDSHEWR